MAEQTSHNVVINSESTGAFAQVDTAADNSTTDSAVSSKTTTSSNTLSETLSAVGSAVKSLLPNGTTSEQTGSNAAEPSAGEAGDQSALKVPESQATRPAHGGLANGVHEDNSQVDGHADDKSTAGGSVDMNVNSDTDNSKVDAGEKPSGHRRTNSTVKKPTGFSKVNATKSFLSKITPSAPTAPQAGDKPTPASAVLQPANRPRLIAKTGASQSMLKPRMGSTGAGAPDASKVWNKNQPVVAPPPKQLTDEELKQQFGIHLATRLQTDGDKKDSNWADIDDDEDDWAPETVVWMDGTKSTVPKDATPVPGEEEQKPAVHPTAKTTDGIKPALALKQRSDRPERPMQILKPGATTIQARQNGGLAASSPAGQKASLTAKSPAAAPAKSPWAPVPKPDSVAPINPPVQVPPPPRALPSQDARSSEPMAPLPAREIAADTFDRSWQRDSGARELFNSSNGRYEPAPEGRRGSIRQDISRKPAVLQRPSQALSPAPEPSPAFQSRSSSQMDGSWGSRRRRDSSVSQGSMPGHRRMSMNKASEFAPTPEVPSAVKTSPNVVAGRPNFNQQSAWDKQMPPAPGPHQDASAAPVEAGPPPEDPVKVQERIMQEKREAAKRRKEEEAREEAAKKERLAAKLAALEGAGKSRSERAAEAASRTAIEKPAPASEVDGAAANESLSAKPTAASASSNSPAIVETPAPVQTQQSVEKMASPPQPQASLAGLATRDDQTRPQPPSQQRAPIANARTPFGQQQQSTAYRAPTSSYSSPGERKSQPAPLGRSPGVNNDSFSPWPTTTNNNIWGSGFGNGVFDSGSAFAPMATSQQNSSLPPPPGMSRAPGSTRISPQGFNQDSRSPSLGQPQLSEQQRAFPAPGMSDRSAPFGPSQPRLTGISPSQAPGYGRPHHPPGPIGPPSRAQHQNQSQQQQLPVQRPLPSAADVSGWQAAATNHMPNEPLPEHRFKETFKQTSAEPGGKLGAPRKVDAVEHTIHDGSGSRTVAGFSPAPPNAQTQPIAPPPAASPAQDARTDTSSGSTVRMPNPSQNPAHGGLPRHIAPPHRVHAERLLQQRNAALATAPLAPNVASKEQFAPPPEVESHPVYSGDARHPQVRLPKPQPVVRLPQAALPSTSPQTQSRSNISVVMPTQRQSYRYNPPGAVQPIVANESWQHRFNGLFGRAQVQTEAPPSPPRTPPKSQGVSLAVASSSIEPMATQTGGATVSLPQGLKNRSAQTPHTLETTSKPGVDFSNERSFGSLPKVKVPSKARYHPEVGSLSAHKMLTTGLPKFARVESGFYDLFFWRNPMGIFVNIPQTRLNNRLCRDKNHIEPLPKAERKPHQPRGQHDQQSFAPRDRKHLRVNEPGQSGPGSRKSSQAFKTGEQQHGEGTEVRKPSGKFANKKMNEREHHEKRDSRKVTHTQDARLTSTPPKGQSATSSKRSSVHVSKEQKPQTPPPAQAAPLSAKEATIEKRKSGVTKPATPSASANRFDLLATMASPSKA